MIRMNSMFAAYDEDGNGSLEGEEVVRLLDVLKQSFEDCNNMKSKDAIKS